MAAKKQAASSAPHQDGAWAKWFVRKPGETRYWLVKSEPDVFSFDQLLKAPKQTTCWDGVRNFSARNFLRDGMKKGDQVFHQRIGGLVGHAVLFKQLRGVIAKASVQRVELTFRGVVSTHFIDSVFLRFGSETGRRNDRHA